MRIIFNSASYSITVNFVFVLVTVVSVAVLTVTSPDSVLSSMIGGASTGLTFALKLFAVYAVWNSILKIWENIGFIRFFARKTTPFLRKLFPGEEEPAYGDLAVNLSANFLGMGGAGTPAGISATKKMNSAKNRSVLIVLNSTSVQLIPSTVIALRSTFGSQTDIIIPTLISTIVSSVIGVFLVKIFVGKSGKK